jgi:hypothetical protein
MRLTRFFLGLVTSLRGSIAVDVRPATTYTPFYMAGVTLFWDRIFAAPELLDGRWMLG